MADIEVFEPQVTLTRGEVKFQSYEKLKSQAMEIADFISQMEVTDENVKVVKKVLARANKAVKQLNDKRIEIKKAINEPYEAFNSQVKEIESIVKEADQIVRSQVRNLEEQERQKKAEDLKEIWDLRIAQYDLARIFDFEDWLTPKHLNKSESMSKVEQDMTDFLEKSERDLEVIRKHEDCDELMLVYKEEKDLAMSLQIVSEKKRLLQEQEEILKDSEVEKAEKYIFEVYSKKDANLLELLMRENDISYRRI